MVKDAEEQVRLIQSNLKVAQSYQKNYTDKTHRPLVFKVGNQVYLQVSPMKVVQHFGVMENLAPHYVGPFPITEECGPVAYPVELPPHLSALHNIFHLSQLKKCLRVPAEAINTNDIHIAPDLTYPE